MAKMSGGGIDNHAKLYLYGSNITYNTGSVVGGYIIGIRSIQMPLIR